LRHFLGISLFRKMARVPQNDAAVATESSCESKALKKFFEFLRLSVTTAGAVWKVVTFLIILAGGTTAGVLAAGTQLFKSFGPLASFAAALLAALVTALILFLVRKSQNAAAQANLATALASRPSEVNPLLKTFEDAIIPIHALRLPGAPVHRYKHFRRCKFVGPGAMALFGGTFVQSKFQECGDLLTLPDAMITGLTVLQDCTVEDCEFYQITLFFPRNAAEQIRRGLPGAVVRE
jgi:hypothetical protein